MAFPARAVLLEIGSANVPTNTPKWVKKIAIRGYQIKAKATSCGVGYAGISFLVYILDTDVTGLRKDLCA